MTYLLALDQGTSSSRSIIFRPDGSILASAQAEFRQIYPQPGWVEHDPEEIWQSQLATARQALSQAGVSASSMASVGITNQRETTVVWRRDTGQAIYNAIVWQDRRAEPQCLRLRQAGHADKVQHKTGLLIDAYFSATKLQWILNHVEGARGMAELGDLAFGTVDSWLIWKLSAGAVHATDVSNAPRCCRACKRRRATLATPQPSGWARPCPSAAWPVTSKARCSVKPVLAQAKPKTPMAQVASC